MKRLLLLGLLNAFAQLNAHAAVINHDAVQGFAQQAPANSTQAAELAFKPYLYVVNGCVPFPAVDAAGNVSGGLKPSGGPSANCSHSTGQIYARSGWYQGVWAIMYSWYFPKDEPSTGIGHRHDWEGAVVWIDSPDAAQPKLLAVSVSRHGKFVSYSPVDASNLSGNHPLIEYRSDWPIDHTMYISTTVGGTQPLVDWEQLTQAARYTLSNTDFGSANVPFIDSAYTNNLAKAWFR